MSSTVPRGSGRGWLGTRSVWKQPHVADRHQKSTACSWVNGGKEDLLGRWMLNGEAIILPDRQERRGACSQWGTCSVSFKEMVELLGLLSLGLWVIPLLFQFLKYLQADGEPQEAYFTFALNSRFDYLSCSRKR